MLTKKHLSNLLNRDNMWSWSNLNLNEFLILSTYYDTFIFSLYALTTASSASNTLLAIYEYVSVLLVIYINMSPCALYELVTKSNTTSGK